MERSERIARLKAMLAQVAADEDKDLEALSKSAPPTLEGVEGDGESIRAYLALEKLAQGRDEDVSDAEASGLEAIVLLKQRPVVFIQGGRYQAVDDPWQSLNEDPVRARLQPLLASVGRLELPNSPQYPYGGTAFIVGPGLVMTNRHVARLFSEGVGVRKVVFRPGDAAIDFLRERTTPENDRSALVVVTKVEMVHPYWDMAILRVEGLPPGRPILTLGVRSPEELVGSDVVVVGYPARDDRNDLAAQDRIFQRTYNVKRFQPGKIRGRAPVKSFDYTVPALTHDSSTLGGNSGSAILDVATGELVGLHFAGVYLKGNYGVPAYELARDPRIVDLGVRFSGAAPANDDVTRAWQVIEPEEARLASVRPPPVAPAVAPRPAVAADGASVSFTIPLQITVSVGEMAGAGAAVVSARGVDR
jgi:endonuclease G